MPAEPSDIRTLPHTDAATGRTITRLQYRGWFVDVDANVVSIPRQRITNQHPADLQVCLAAACALARNTSQPAPAPPTAKPPRRAPAHVLVALLHDARIIASTRWHPNHFDIYVCTRTAWEEAESDLPFTTVLTALRRVLTPGATLTDYSDCARGRRDITALYDKAIAALTGPTAAQGAA